MNDETAKPLDLGMDLTFSFQPAWAKEPSPKENAARLSQYADFAEKTGDSPSRNKPWQRDGGPRNPNNRGDRRPGGGERRERQGDNRKGRDGRDSRDGRSARPNDGRDGRRQRDGAENRPRHDWKLRGWEVTFTSEPSGVDGLARQIKSTLKAYPLFDLARLVLEKPARYFVRMTPGDGAQTLWQVVADSSLWLSSEDAANHALRTQLDRYYKRVQVTVEPPKGNFPCVAQCGICGEIIGPPNHHDYQANLRKLHASRFRQMPFEAFTSRVKIVREEELVAKWKEQQCVREEFIPLDSTEENPKSLASLAEAERHFRATYLPACIIKIESKCRVSGTAAAVLSADPVRNFIREEYEKISRFPLPLAHSLGQSLSAQGLQIFKAHENITYVSVARPHYLDRVANPISANLAELLNFVESNEKISRHDQWKGLLEMRGAPSDGSDPERLKAAESSVAADLTWLLHEGFVVDYAGKGLELPRPNKKTSSPDEEKKQKPQQQKPNSKKQRPSERKPNTAPAQPKDEKDSAPTPPPTPAEEGQPELSKPESSPSEEISAPITPEPTHEHTAETLEPTSEIPSPATLSAPEEISLEPTQKNESAQNEIPAFSQGSSQDIEPIEPSTNQQNQTPQ